MTKMRARDGISRRRLLIGGGIGVGLLVGWAAWPRSYRHNLTAAPDETIFDAFLKIGADGRVAVVVPQAEMGQGVYTSLPQILADELGADWRTVSVEPAPINPLYANSFLMEESARETLPSFLAGIGTWAMREVAIRSELMITGGSTSVRAFEQRYREAGASARALLCMAGGKRWDADWRACDTADGFVVHGDDRLRFGELAEAAAALTPPKDVPLRKPGAGKISGASSPRLDLPSKVDGSARFAGDVRLPGMLFAAVRHGPHGATRLAQITPADADKVPGVVAVFENPGWAAVAATNWWAAAKGLDALSPTFETSGLLPDNASIAKALRDAIDGDGGKRFVDVGDIDKGFEGGERVSATYSVPYASHSPMEPLTATARITGDRLELWMPTQAPAIARKAAARAIGFAERQVTVYPILVGGGFGRKVDVDAAEQAAILARQLGRPVQVTWSRTEETMRGRGRPPALGRMSARLGPGGAILAWQAEIAAPSTMGEIMGRLMKGVSGEHGAEGGAVEGARPPYAIPAVAVDHRPAAIGIETGMWRSVANSYTAFFNECFIDELARKAGIEPLSFRMQMLGGNPRLAQCLTTVTALGAWEGGQEGSAQGLAAHSCFGSHVAMMAEAHVGKDQRIKVDRVVAAVDCGRVINPDIVRQQIEGGIIWGIAATLGANLDFERGLATARNFDALNLPILADMPEIVIEIIRSGEAPGGVGEIAVPPVAPAIANAIFAATGQRLRDLPLRTGAA
jgi:isoquinoline 1-oxidoreductase beta subunit